MKQSNPVAVALVAALVGALVAGCHEPGRVAPQVCADEPIMDFNGNGIDDAIDISDGTSLDENLNGIPDEAEVN